MKLFVFPVAPNPAKVRLYLAEKRALTESLAIVEYLEEICPRPSLLIATARVMHATKSPLGLPPAPEVAAQATLLL
jgi:glutathione S-transferase